MTTLEELIYYCKEPKPVGAVLLSGEWGCGKTYLIEHDLKDMLKEKFYILRISLFGITSIEEIHKSVREKWLEAYYESKNISNVAEKIQKGKEIIAKVEVLPDIIKGVAATNWTSFIEIKEKIGDKSVVLVFDDLERCCLNSVDVLGGINDYCENQKFHTIVIANQEKMCTNIEEHQINAEIEVKDVQEKKIDKCERKKLDLKICVPPKTAPGAISYSEIKEKIIQRTVKYIPDYKSIICAVIEELQFQDIESSGKEYKRFVKECENGILELFAPDIENGANEENENLHSSSQEKKSSRKSNMLSTHERPHNIRSLKCAISDFYRVYIILKENDFSDIDKWFYSFVSYVLSYKADIAKEGVYGTIFSDEEVRKLYPAFQNQYIFNAVKKWILRGVWNKEEIYYEIEILKKREKAKTPAEIVKTYRIVDVDEFFKYKIDVNELSEWSISCSNWMLKKTSLYSIYYRKPILPDLCEYEEAYHGMIAKDISSLINGIVDDFEGKVLTKPSVLRKTENKTFQLLYAARKGFQLPRSYIGNNKNVVLECIRNRKSIRLF